jgi:hypothetical protein
MYRLLEAHGEVRERRDQLTHPPYQKPELMATAPNRLWSWDITTRARPDALPCHKSTWKSCLPGSIRRASRC